MLGALCLQKKLISDKEKTFGGSEIFRQDITSFRYSEPFFSHELLVASH